MAQKPATPGTGLHGPIYILDSDGEVTGQVAATPSTTSIEYDALATVGDTSQGDESTGINSNFAELLATIVAVAAAVGVTVSEAA